MENIGELADGVELFLSDGRKGCSGCWMLECVDQIQCSLGGGIGGRSVGHGTVVGEKFDSFGNAFGGGSTDVHTVTAIVLGSCSDVPAIHTMQGPGVAVGWCFVDEHSCAGRSEGSSIVIEGSVQLCFGGESGIKSCRPE